MFEKHLGAESAERHSGALQCFHPNIASLSSLRPRLSRIFTGSLLVIVFSFSRCPPVTNVLSGAVQAEPRRNTDFLSSVGVTIPGRPVPLQT